MVMCQAFGEDYETINSSFAKFSPNWNNIVYNTLTQGFDPRLDSYVPNLFLFIVVNSVLKVLSVPKLFPKLFLLQYLLKTFPKLFLLQYLMFQNFCFSFIGLENSEHKKQIFSSLQYHMVKVLSVSILFFQPSNFQPFDYNRFLQPQ